MFIKVQRSSFCLSNFSKKCVQNKKPLPKVFDRGNGHPFLTFIQTIVEETILE